MLSGSAGFLRAEPSVNVRSETASLIVDEPFRLRIEVGGVAGEPEIPAFPATPDFVISGVAHAPSLKINGQTVHILHVEIVPEREGILTLPPFTLKAGDSTIQTPPVRLSVTAPHRTGDMELMISLLPAEVWVDQVAEVTVTWISQVPFVRLKGLLFDLPLLRLDHLDTYPVEPFVSEEKRIGLPVDQERVIARKGDLPKGGQALVFSCKVVPRAPGTFRSPDARLDCSLLREAGVGTQYISCFNNGFFEQPGPEEHFEQVYLTAPVPALIVKALPVDGRTPLYAGIVGTFSATASVDSSDTVVGRPMLLSITMNDLDFGPAVGAIPSASLDGLEPEFSVVREPIHESASETSRSFTFVIHPLRAGLDRIPAIAFQCFDPHSAQYKTVRTAPIPIHVAPDGDRTFYQPDARSNEPAPIPLSGIRQNRTDSPVLMKICQISEFFARLWWLWIVAPPVCWLFLRPLAAWFELRRTRPAYARAARRFRRTFPKNADLAWRNYLADRLGLDASALTAETVLGELRSRRADPALIEDVRRKFGQQDAVFYSKDKEPSADDPSFRLLVRRIQKATCLSVLLLICLPLAASGKSPEDLFVGALRIRAEKPDEARPLFARAALEFEAEGKFLNAANSWFFSGENGRAFANYRAAETRAPFDRQIRESIAFIRAQHAGDISPSGGPVARGVWFWSEFCRWQPALRGGWIVMVYLSGWLLFFASRFCGFRVHRAVWTVLAAVAAVLSISLLVSAFQPREGVIIQQTAARLGPGYAYDPAFKEQLTDATEFLWLESRDGWVHARFPDNSEAWLASPSVLQVK